MYFRQNGEIHSPFPSYIYTDFCYLHRFVIFCYYFIYLTYCCKRLRKMCRLRFKIKEEARKLGKRNRREEGWKGEKKEKREEGT